MNVLETIQKSIQAIDNLKEEDVATDEVYMSAISGRCCLVGKIGKDLGCDEDEMIGEWALGTDKPCLIEAFESRDLAEIIDYNLSKIHQEYVNHVAYEKYGKEDAKKYEDDKIYWKSVPQLNFKQMKKEAKRFLKSLLPEGGK